MMENNQKEYRVALITESLWKMAGANRVLESFSKIYPDADIYALFGSKENLSKELQDHNIYFSLLNRIPLIKKIYRYTFHLWPMAVEQFDLSEYDLVISNSSSVVHGVITPMECKHVVYINSPMRYAWDLSHIYSSVVKFGFFKRVFKEVFVSFNRMWDVSAAQRGDILIANSSFVAKRVRKYWKRDVDSVIYPPSRRFEDEIISEREDYFVAGAPFEPNKRGDLLLEFASVLGFNLKIIGDGSMRKKLERKYRKFKNIQFLGWISEEEKWKLISNAKGFLIGGIEDYGIFCVEALSSGTPILAYSMGGSLEIVREGVNGFFYDDWSLESFKKSFELFEKKSWNYEDIPNTIINANTVDSFENEIKKMLVE